MQDFASFYDGMGKFSFTPQPGKNYEAVITSPFQLKQAIALPAAINSGYSLSVQPEKESIKVNMYVPEKTKCEVLIRNNDKVYTSIPVNAKKGINDISIPTSRLPVGLYAVSLVADNKIYAERLIFINYQDGLKIEIETDKKEYLPREKVLVSVTTKDKNDKPIASSLSVSVADEKILSYIDDKQHNLLTWMFFGSELKGEIHEPRFYFDDKEPLEKRLQALDLILNTHGWRRYSHDDVNNFDGQHMVVMPEKSSDIEGFILNKRQKGVSRKVYLITDTGKVYETKSSNSGYFKFTRTHFETEALLVAESRNGRNYTVKNSISDLNDIIRLKDSMKVSYTGYKTIEPVSKQATIAPAEQRQIIGSVDLKSDGNNLEEVVVDVYRSTTVRSSASAVTTIVSYSQPVLQNLQGQVAGLQISTGTGQPGSASTVILRGYSSLYGNRAASQPLYVIDGIPYADNENASIFSTLSPEMIESIRILKDAAATSVYGNRGANGVIIINTKNRTTGNGILLGRTNHYTYQNITKNNSRKVNTAVAFYAPKYTSTVTDRKTDFRNCIYWNGTVQTDAQGKAKFEYFNSDDATTFTIIAEGTSYKGDLGRTNHSYIVKELIETDLKVPLYSTQEDLVRIPLWIKNNSTQNTTLTASLKYSDYFEAAGAGYTQNITLAANEARVVHFPVKLVKTGKGLPVNINLGGTGYAATIEKTIDVYGKGFPVSMSFSGTKTTSGSFTIGNALENSIQSELKFVVNPYNELSEGLEAMLREPHGCFEQVSSTNYPNIIALQLLSRKGGMDEEFRKKAVEFLKNGYNKLKNYESKGGGFEWYGGSPAHESLTAYGLLQFHEMKNFIHIDADLVERSVDWLYSRKDGKGGFKQNSGKYGFSSIKSEVNNAYIVYVLSEIGAKDFKKEYLKALEEALQSRDIYRSALLALAAYNRNDITSYKKLLANIRSDIKGKDFNKIEIGQTVVHSYGTSRTVEWLALYALAIMKEQKLDKELLEVLDHIQSSKNRNGFGSTQATALALKAIVTFSGIAHSLPGQPNISANVNRVSLGTATDASGNITINTTGNIIPGKNDFNIAIEDGRMVPYLLYVNYLSYIPDNSPDCQLKLKTTLTNNKIKVSETTRIEIELTNKTKGVVQNPLVRIGLPGGVSPEPWQLKELIEKNIIDYYEIIESELVLYFREFNALETRKINIDVKAQVPGNYAGIASSAYLYYNNEHKNWNNGLLVEITE